MLIDAGVVVDSCCCWLLFLSLSLLSIAVLVVVVVDCCCCWCWLVLLIAVVVVVVGNGGLVVVDHCVAPDVTLGIAFVAFVGIFDAASVAVVVGVGLVVDKLLMLLLLPLLLPL